MLNKNGIAQAVDVGSAKLSSVQAPIYLIAHDSGRPQCPSVDPAQFSRTHEKQRIGGTAGKAFEGMSVPTLSVFCSQLSIHTSPPFWARLMRMRGGEYLDTFFICYHVSYHIPLVPIPVPVLVLVVVLSFTSFFTSPSHHQCSRTLGHQSHSCPPVAAPSISSPTLGNSSHNRASNFRSASALLYQFAELRIHMQGAERGMMTITVSMIAFSAPLETTISTYYQMDGVYRDACG